MASVINIPPHGNIKLYSGIDIGNGRQRIFQNRAQQEAYFNAHLFREYNDMSYMRLSSGIKIEITNDQMMNCNFISFTNKMSGIETEVYASINPNWEYVNNNTVIINYAVDWFQTCMFTITMKEGSIEREHLSEAEWNTALANPYAEIHQLRTIEDALPMDDTMMDISSTADRRVTVAPGRTPSTLWLMLLVANQNFDDIPSWKDMIKNIQRSGGKYYYNSLVQGVPNICACIMLPYNTIESIDQWTEVFKVIEANDLTGNIMGLYYVPAFYALSIDDDLTQHDIPSGMCTIEISKNIQDYSPRNPKLRRAPYCYIRAYDNCGQFKNYYWEDFIDVINGELTAKFRVIFNINGQADLMLAPYKYKIMTGDPDDVTSSWMNLLNYDELLVYSDIPYIPYATDGYVTYQSKLARNAIQNTGFGEATMNTIGNIASPIMSVLGGVGGVSSGISSIGGGENGIGQVTGGAGNVLGGLNKAFATNKGNVGFANLKTSLAYMENLAGPRDLTNNEVAGFAMGIPGNARSALVRDNVTKGSVKGFAGYMRDPLRFTIVRVIPRPDIVEIYDKYFDYFGYASARVGLPHVYDYIRGGDNPPHFANVGGEEVTYAKANIFCYTNGKAPDVAARYIEEVFRVGTLFVKG